VLSDAGRLATKPVGDHVRACALDLELPKCELRLGEVTPSEPRTNRVEQLGAATTCRRELLLRGRLTGVRQRLEVALCALEGLLLLALTIRSQRELALQLEEASLEFFEPLEPRHRERGETRRAARRRRLRRRATQGPSAARCGLLRFARGTPLARVSWCVGSTRGRWMPLVHQPGCCERCAGALACSRRRRHGQDGLLRLRLACRARFFALHRLDQREQRQLGHGRLDVARAARLRSRASASRSRRRRARSRRLERLRWHCRIRRGGRRRRQRGVQRAEQHDLALSLVALVCELSRQVLHALADRRPATGLLAQPDLERAADPQLLE
jgi:hypothetical protein